MQFEALQHLVQLLPAPNRDTLWALLNFLAVVALNANDQTDVTGNVQFFMTLSEFYFFKTRIHIIVVLKVNG